MRFITQISLFLKNSKYRRFLSLLLFVSLFLVLAQIIFSFLNKPEIAPDIQYLKTIPPQAEQVETGIFAMNLYNLEASSNTYYLDFYIWFRWKGEIDPTDSLEFGNVVEDWGMVSVPIYEEPEELPDGSYYQALRVEGRFIQPLIFDRYPLDRHSLNILVENSIYTIDQLVYVADSTHSGYSSSISLPDWKIQGFDVSNMVRQYPTNFGDTRIRDKPQYSIFRYSLNITRPVNFFVWKLLLPLIIVIAVSWGALFLNPQHIDSRIGLPVTGLLTAVFLQQSYSANLPDIGHLVLLDKIYVMVYTLIFISIFEAITTADWIQNETPDNYKRVRKLDRIMLTIQPILLLVSIVLIILLS